MNQQEVASIVRGISAAVLVNVSKALGQFSERMTALEQRVAAVRDGRDGVDGQMGPAGPQGEAGAVGPAGADGLNGQDGAPGRDVDEAHVLALTKEIETLRDELVVLKARPLVVERTIEAAVPFPVDVPALVKVAVADAMSALPVPCDGQDGASVTLDELRPVVAVAVSEAVSALPVAKDGAPGRDADIDDIEALVIKTLAQWPQPQDGASVTVEDVRPLVAGEVEKHVAAIPPAINGKDGIGVLGVLIDREGHLVATLSDGTVTRCGLVIGRDGRDADMTALEQRIVAELEKWPRPKDGEPGAAGRDGTLEQIKFVQSEDFRTVTACCKDGTPIEGGVFTFPVVLDCGVFKAGTTYLPGSGVTWAGSFWIAQRETSGKPGEGDSGWRLSVKRGGDGREGKAGINGKDGAPGPPGRDGTKTW